jgi:chemotaxis protein methyltransferase CheR
MSEKQSKANAAPVDVDVAQHDQADIALDRFLEAVCSRYSYDFAHYSRSFLRRRIAYAMPKFHVSRLGDLEARILHDPLQFRRFLQILTVPTTSFFRDPFYFEVLRNQVLPVLRTYPSLKVWVAGCSTGEELYSLAIIFREEDLWNKTVFYATDINPQSLERARRGIFSLECVAEAAPRYREAGGRRSLADYCSVGHDAVQLDPDLIKQTVFADHSLATDEVFSEVHLVSCRNVLIYFDRSLQDRAIGLFTRSLVYGGFLGLGPKESIQFSTYRASYELLDKPARIYKKITQ